MDELVQVLMTYDWGGGRGALAGITKRVAQVHGNPDDRDRLEGQLLLALESGAPLPAKEFVCRQLAIIGTARSVPALGRMLAAAATSDMARMALEQIPGPEAGAVLREALPKLSGLPRSGVAASLGQRRDAAAVGALCELLTGDDDVAAEVAAQALGQVAGARAAEGLARAQGETSGRVRRAILDARLRCADQYAAHGKREEAQGVYAALREGSMPEPIREAAAVGLKKMAKGATS